MGLWGSGQIGMAGLSTYPQAPAGSCRSGSRGLAPVDAPMFVTAEQLIMAGFGKSLGARVEACITETYPDYALS